MLVLRLLGNAALLDEHGAVSGRAVQRRRLALLSLLALSPRKSLSRDKVLALLWPESDTEQARHLLAVAVYELRKSLGEHTLLTGRDDITLSTEHVSIDVDNFNTALDAGDFEKAVQLYGGPLLEGFHISDAPEFDRWMDGERTHFARRYAEALEKLAEQLAAKGDAAGAISAWRRLSSHDPYSARVARGLMSALEQAGDRAGALQHARSHAALLREEFGAEPDPDVEALAARLRSDPTATAAATTAPLAASAWKTAPPAQSRPRKIGRLLTMILTASAVIGMMLFVRSRIDRASAIDSSTASIAVLPFENLSPADTTGFFADGLSEEIISALSHVPRLNVVARSSAFEFRGHVDVREVGRRLGVAHVVAGTVRMVGDRVKVTAHLISTKNGYEVWSDAYDRPMQMAQLISIQEDIAQAAVAALTTQLGGEPRARLMSPTTHDVQAFEMYVTGRHFYHRRTVPDLQRAVAYFDQAIARDSTYALAYAAKGEALTLLGAYDYGALPPNIAFTQARAAANRALAINPNLAEAHAVLASTLWNYDWNWAAAEKEFRRTIAISPGYAAAYHWYSLLLHTRGRVREAFANSMRASELDPLDRVISTGLARHYYLNRQTDEAIKEYHRTLAADSTFVTAHIGLGMSYAAKGAYPDAIREYQTAARFLQMSPPLVEGLLANAYGRSGKMGEAAAHLRVLEAMAARHYVPAEYLLLAHIGVGDRDAAFRDIGQAQTNRSAGMIYLGIEPILDPIRSDPRFTTILAKLPQ